MRSLILVAFVSAAAVALAAGPGDRTVNTTAQQPAAALPSRTELTAMTARFVPAEIAADISSLDDRERRALAKLVDAARLMDSLFLRQVWSGNDAMLQHLARQGDDLGRARLHYFLINKGPWSRLDNDRIFIPGAPAKPGGANFYPEGTMKEEIQKWIDALPPGQKESATGFFTTVRRGADNKLVAIPYSLEYQPELTHAATLLREAADLTAEPSLKKFLTARADAFLSNDYYASDVAWMELDATLEPTIGPYEVYEDEWFNYKAGFEAFITVRDASETKKLQVFSSHLQELENALPIDPALRNPKLGSLAPIRVVNVVFTAGDANRGVQTAAYNLPNDERVVKEKGTKRVMLKNVQDAKFNKVLLPISRVALTPADQKNVSFEAFFTHILMHELMHGLGPHNITVGGRTTTVRQELKDTYSAIEEAKADVSGLWALQQLADKQQVDASIAKAMYTTFLASAFRSIRFGVNEAHGKGIAVQLNYLLDAGAFTINADGTFAVDDAKIKQAVTALTREIMTLQAEGSYPKAKGLIDRLGNVRPSVQKVLDKLTQVPVDIEPRFTTADTLAGR